MQNVLVTGGTGFFGRAFVCRALTLGARRICVYSRDEWKQAQMRSDLKDDERLRFFIGDVRDKDRLRRAMRDVDTVIHAAALKRIEVGEYNPDELAKTNVLGALNVIEAAEEAGVRDVVALSTDKAAAPCNAYGTSKLLAEKLFLASNNARGSSGPNFAVTRYGNVSASTGSLIPTWRKLLAEGKRLPVTHPDMTRFWMTVDQAVDLVLSAIGLQTLIVPSLPAYRVGDLAEAMGGETEIVGIRRGEKMHEAMISSDECSDFMMVGDHFEWQPDITEAKLTHALTSDRARRMSVDELREALRAV